jgi:hypothetical protein
LPITGGAIHQPPLAYGEHLSIASYSPSGSSACSVILVYGEQETFLRSLSLPAFS